MPGCFCYLLSFVEISETIFDVNRLCNGVFNQASQDKEEADKGVDIKQIEIATSRSIFLVNAQSQLVYRQHCRNTCIKK